MFPTSILVALTFVGSMSPVSPIKTSPTRTAPVKTTVATRQTASAPILQAQGHPMHVNFFNASSKRSDLRLRTIKQGVDAAFTQWLQEEHPHIYKHAVENAMVGVK